MMKFLYKLLMIFVGAIILVNILNILGFWGLLIIIILPIFGYSFFIYWIIKNKERLKKKDIKKLIPYYLLLPFFVALDGISTYFFVINKGIEYEINIIVRFLYGFIGNYALFLTFLIMLSLIILLSLYTSIEKDIYEAIKVIKIFFALYVMVFVFNLLI